MRRFLLIFLAALPFIVALIFLIATKRSVPAADLPLPDPNGYDKFVQAGKALRGDPDLFESMSRTDLEALVADNADSLALAHSALTNQCRVPIQYSITYMQDHMNDLLALRKLGGMMLAEGRLAELENNKESSVNDYLDVIHLGIECGRGGLMTDVLIGDGIEKAAQKELKNMADSSNSSSCQAIAGKLEALNADRQDWNDVLQKEDRLLKKLSPGWQSIFVEILMHKQISATRKKAKETFQATELETLNLTVQFAAHAYELDHGKPPVNIRDLVPAYLKSVPRDPSNGREMVYPFR